MGVGSGGEVFEVEALAEVFGTRTNLVVGFLQCPDDVEFIAQEPGTSGICEPVAKSISSRACLPQLVVARHSHRFSCRGLSGRSLLPSDSAATPDSARWFGWRRGPAETGSARGPRPRPGIISRRSSAYHGGKLTDDFRFASRTSSRCAGSFARSAPQGSFPDISGGARAETMDLPINQPPPSRCRSQP